MKKLFWIFAALCSFFLSQNAAAWTVYFDNSTKNFSTPTIWAWQTSGTNCNANGTWPGDAMELVSGNIYKWDLPDGKDTPDYLIFSDNGSNQYPSGSDGGITAVDGYVYDATSKTGTPYTITLPVNMPLKESDFAGNQKHYFIVGTRTADWRLQPEWELQPQADGTYALSNRLLYTGYMGVAVVDNYESYIKQTYDLYAYSGFWVKAGALDPSLSLIAENAQGDPSTNGSFTVSQTIHFVYNTPSGINENNVLKCSPTLATMTLTLDDNGLPKQLLFSDCDDSFTTTNKYITWSIVGSMTTNDNLATYTADTPLGVQDDWQEGWIQYDSDGQPYVDGNGQYVYQTCFQYEEWLKNHPSYFYYKGHSFTSNNLVLHYADANEATLPPSDSGENMYTNYNGTATGADSWSTTTKTASEENGGKYLRYVCEDMFLDGNFKMWTGWGGVDKRDDGANLPEKNYAEARWYYRNAGHYKDMGTDGGLQLTSDLAAYYHTAIDVDNANFGMPALTYFKRIEFYLDPRNDAAEAIYNSAIHFCSEAGGPQIVATRTGKRELSYTPSVPNVKETSAENYHVKSYVIKRYKVNADGTTECDNENVSSATFSEGEMKATDIDEYFSQLFDIDTDGDGVNDAIKDPDIIGPGLWQYEIEVTYYEDDDPVSSKSNQVQIYQETAPTINGAYQVMSETSATPEGSKAVLDNANGEFHTFDVAISAGMPSKLLDQKTSAGDRYAGQLVESYTLTFPAYSSTENLCTGLILGGTTDADGNEIAVGTYFSAEELTDGATLTFTQTVDGVENKCTATVAITTTADGNSVMTLTLSPLSGPTDTETEPTADSWAMPKVRLVNVIPPVGETVTDGKFDMEFIVEMTASDGDTEEWEDFNVTSAVTTATVTAPALSLATTSTTTVDTDDASPFISYDGEGKGRGANYIDADGIPCYKSLFDLPFTANQDEVQRQLWGDTEAGTNYTYQPTTQMFTRLNYLKGTNTLKQLMVTDDVLANYQVDATLDITVDEDNKLYKIESTTTEPYIDLNTADGNEVEVKYLPIRTTSLEVDGITSDCSLYQFDSSSQVDMPYAISTSYTRTDAAASAFDAASTNGNISYAMPSIDDSFAANIQNTEIDKYNRTGYESTVNNANKKEWVDALINLKGFDTNNYTDGDITNAAPMYGFAAYVTPTAETVCDVRDATLLHSQGTEIESYNEGGEIMVETWAFDDVQYTWYGQMDNNTPATKTGNGNFGEVVRNDNANFSELATATNTLPVRILRAANSNPSVMAFNVKMLQQFPFSTVNIYNNKKEPVIAIGEKNITASEAAVLKANARKATTQTASNDAAMRLITFTAEYTVTSNNPVTGIDGIAADGSATSLSIWPNPASGQVNIAAPVTLGTVKIYSVAGQLVKTVETDNASATFDVSNLHTGLYIVRAAGTAQSLIVK